MTKGLRSLIVIALTISLGTGSVFFVFPKKAEAGVTDCLAGVLFGQTKGKAEVIKANVGGVGRTVPVKDATVKAMVKANANINANTAGQTQGFTVQRCIVEPLVTVMVRSLLNTFTAQTISWINSGFKGSPLYVTNPEGFLTDIADQSLGQFIQGLGPIGQILCSPFDLQLRFSLNLQFNTGGNYYKEIGCRLTDIQQNIQKTFTGGSFGANGWDNWLQLTATPQNNPYGAFIKASETLSSTIGNRQEGTLRELDWGKGFLSSTDPETGEINTPGSLIEDQLSKTLGVEVERVGLAKDIDAILGALANQLINQVMGGVGGLLGASRRSGAHTASGNYPSANGTYPNYVQTPVERARNSTPASIIASNEAAQGLPDGFYVETSPTIMLGPTATGTTDEEFGKPIGPSPVAFCTAFKKNFYSASKAKDSDPLTAATPVVVKIGAADKTGDALAAVANTATKKDGAPSQWNLADYNRISAFCQSVNITAPIGNAARDFSERTKNKNDLPDEELSQENQIIQLAINRETDQSSTCNAEPALGHTPEAKNAVDGNTESSFFYGIAATCDNGDNNWWQVDLGGEKPIGKIKIYKTSTVGTIPGLEERTGFDMQYPFSVIVTKSDLGKDVNLKNIIADNVNVFRMDYQSLNASLLEISLNNTGRYVRIQSAGLVSTAEVDVTGVANNFVIENNVPKPAIVFTPAEQESRPNIDNHYNLSFRNFLSAFKMTASQAQTGLKARIKLLGIKADGSSQTPQFSSIFEMGSLKINDTVSIDVQESSVVFNNSFDLYQGQTVDYRITARITDDPSPVFTSTNTYLSYKMVMEFFKIVNNREQSIASSTTMFKIQ